MKVLVQFWRLDAGGEKISISKTRKQLRQTITEVDDEGVVPNGNPNWLELKNDGLIEMVESGTVFLNEDETYEIDWES